MFTKTLKTTTGKLKLSIPVTLNEVTMRQLISFHENPIPDFFSELAILANIQHSQLKNINQVDNFKELKTLSEYLLSIAHQMKYALKEDDIPDHIYFGAKKVIVNKNLSMEPVGAFMAAKDVMADEINKHIALHGGADNDEWKETIQPSPRSCTMVLAHYFYVRATGNLYEEQAAEAFYETVVDLPVQSALPIARYFFLSYPNLLQQRISRWDRFRLRLKEELALRRLRRSGSTTR